MLPDPLHPAVIHFPLVLAVLMPFFAVGALWAIRRGARPSRAWALPVVLAAAMAGSAWLATETGEEQEERVEEVVPEAALHEHEEAAERFLVLSGVLLLVAAGGLAGGTFGTAARYVATVGTLAVLVAGFYVGDAGGELVYEHGAANAYTGATGTGQAAEPAAAAGYGERDDD